MTVLVIYAGIEGFRDGSVVLLYEQYFLPKRHELTGRPYLTLSTRLSQRPLCNLLVWRS